MIDGYLLNLQTFREVSDSKAQALKPLEEAAEVFGAWQGRDDAHDAHGLIDECMDTVQAVTNLLAAVGATQGDVDAAIERMDGRNRDRGRLRDGR